MQILILTVQYDTGNGIAFITKISAMSQTMSCKIKAEILSSFIKVPFTQHFTDKTRHSLPVIGLDRGDSDWFNLNTFFNFWLLWVCLEQVICPKWNIKSYWFFLDIWLDESSHQVLPFETILFSLDEWNLQMAKVTTQIQ